MGLGGWGWGLEAGDGLGGWNWGWEAMAGRLGGNGWEAGALAGCIPCRLVP